VALRDVRGEDALPPVARPVHLHHTWAMVDKNEGPKRMKPKGAEELP
jgi:hypothetical protein